MEREQEGNNMINGVSFNITICLSDAGAISTLKDFLQPSGKPDDYIMW